MQTDALVRLFLLLVTASQETVTDNRMLVKSSIGLLLFLATARQGASEMVNLTATTESYLNRTVRYGWKSWGLDGTYEYWTRRHYSYNEYPIFGTVGNFQQDDDCRGPKRSENRVCKEKFMWNIERGIWSPFQLLVNVTVQLKNGSSVTFQLDLNNATSIAKPQRLGLKKTKVATIQLKKCHFLAEVTFDGWFAYKVKERRGDMPDYFAVGIGRLNDIEKGLQGDRRHKLKYNITGTYKHLLVCTNRTTKAKPRTRNQVTLTK
ncbi:uncharacterized protein LOC142578059 isoform X2 [Dermacentor variabilis]|uniref:uncharacterized protein LOC142578059 isoform X2 n=1 Tax=Dermacentor variabilis TaxID=34621 RepID=UPI003F5BF1DE